MMQAVRTIRQESELRGIQIGIQKGMQTRDIEIAKRMLIKGEPQEKVVEFTNLTKAAVAKLAKKLGL